MAWPQVHALGDDKRSRRGGFARRIFLESVDEEAAPLNRFPVQLTCTHAE
jgi:hypothetical protein